MKSTTPFSPARRRLLQRGLWACGSLLLVGNAGTATALEALMHDHAHQHHPIPSAKEGYVRKMVNYTIPDVKLVDANGVAALLSSRLADKPVILNFIFTSCGAICPVMSTTFSHVQAALGAKRDAVHMVSISIDPEHDTPLALKAYASKYGAGPQWQMLTGRERDSIAVQRAFDVYRGNIMSHQPTTFLRARSGHAWVRLDGFASADDIMREYRQLTSN